MFMQKNSVLNVPKNINNLNLNGGDCWRLCGIHIKNYLKCMHNSYLLRIRSGMSKEILVEWGWDNTKIA